jgi:hypothetical protein
MSSVTKDPGVSSIRGGGTNFPRPLYNRGYNFILFWNINRNQTEIDRYWQKNNFLLFAKCLKMYILFAFAFKVCKKCIMTQKKIFLKNINMGIKKAQNFMLISNSLVPAFRNAPNKSQKQKAMKKCTKTKILKIRIVFWH